MKDHAISKTQQAVLDALGLSADNWHEANEQFEALGLVVEAKRSGRGYVPAITIKARKQSAGGWTGEDASFVEYQAYSRLTLAQEEAIAPWVVKDERPARPVVAEQAEEAAPAAETPSPAALYHLWSNDETAFDATLLQWLAARGPALGIAPINGSFEDVAQQAYDAHKSLIAERRVAPLSEASDLEEALRTGAFQGDRFVTEATVVLVGVTAEGVAFRTVGADACDSLDFETFDEETVTIDGVRYARAGTARSLSGEIEDRLEEGEESEAIISRMASYYARRAGETIAQADWELQNVDNIE